MDAESGHRLSFKRCTRCNARKIENTRNVVLCIDGTANEFGRNNTNVVKLFQKIDQETMDPKQVVYYSSGIGTGPKATKFLGRVLRPILDKVDMAFAWNISDGVRDAYDWLARTYQEGDQIYLFGFSRGAYQVQLLVSMIHKIGLVKTQTEKQIRRAFDHYDAIRAGDIATWDLARKFKDTFSWKDLRIHFVGVWDTVSSAGLVRGNMFESLSACACYSRHALALDELRVKFVPEYMHRINCSVDDGRSKYVTASDREHPASSSSGPDCATGRETGVGVADIKEVWFAGSHSDIGGRHRPGRFYHAGKVPLLWMRQEATEKGLVLRPTDLGWGCDDLESGITNSMTLGWGLMELIPIKHQVSFGGFGTSVRRPHLMQPRRIIPGQKVHASILYANSYKPRASWGQGFDILTPNVELDPQPGDPLWETGLFDDAAAEQLVAHLGGEQRVAPVNLDRLLFMLRSKEGKQCVGKVEGWQGKFRKVIDKPSCPALLRLVVVVAYYEVSCDPDAAKSPAQPHDDLPLDTFVKARDGLLEILESRMGRDGPRVLALLRPLTKHKILLDHILCNDVLEKLVEVLDTVIRTKEEYFRQMMDGLICLLQCGETQKLIIRKLKEDSRLERILGIKKPRFLTAALRMVLFLAHIPDGKPVCSHVKPRLRELAGKEVRQVGTLAVEILLVLYDPDEEGQLNIRKELVRSNVAGALVRLNIGPEESAGGGNHGGNADILNHVFGLGTASLTDKQKQLIRALKVAIEKGLSRERTAATLTILKLCETKAIRTFLCQIDLLDVFINQLRHKGSALLAAYGLAVCLRYSDMSVPIKCSDDLPKNIVRMVKHDYFDDAVGPVEGFQILGDLMSDALRTASFEPVDLRGKLSNDEITEVLYTKLAKGKQGGTRTGLICLDIFRSLMEDAPWTKDLVDKSLGYLREPKWKTQKAGVTILSALAQTDHGVTVILLRIPEIVEMLLREGPGPAPPTANEGSPSEAQTGEPTALDPNTLVTPAQHAPSVPPSWMMGPACALRILAQNKRLRAAVRNTRQYDRLKDMFQTNMLVGQMDTSPWRVKTPNRNDVVDEVEKMIEAVDEGLSEEGLMSVGSAVLPHIKHWDRLVGMICGRVVAVVTLPVLLGVWLGASSLSIALAAAVGVPAIALLVILVPIQLSIQAIASLKKLGAQCRDSSLMQKLRGVRNWNGDEDNQGGDEDGQDGDDGGDLDVRAGEGALPRDGSEGSSGAIDGERVQGGAVFEAPGDGEGTSGETGVT